MLFTKKIKFIFLLTTLSIFFIGSTFVHANTVSIFETKTNPSIQEKVSNFALKFYNTTKKATAFISSQLAHLSSNTYCSVAELFIDECSIRGTTSIASAQTPPKAITYTTTQTYNAETGTLSNVVTSTPTPTLADQIDINDPANSRFLLTLLYIESRFNQLKAEIAGNKKTATVSPTRSSSSGGGGVGINTITNLREDLQEQIDIIEATKIEDISGFSTTNLPEGSNLYFTDSRAVSAVTGENISIFTNDSNFISDISSFDTDDLTEGATNLYSQWSTSGSDINYMTGNVGIGTTNPNYLLDVAGDVNVQGTLYGSGSNWSISSSGFFDGTAYNSDYADYAYYGGTSGGILAVNDGNGNIVDDNGSYLSAVYAESAGDAYYGTLSGGILAVNNGSNYVYDDNGNSLSAVYANYLNTTYNGVSTADANGSIHGYNGASNTWSIDVNGNFNGTARALNESYNGIYTANNDGSIHGYYNGSNIWSIDTSGNFNGTASYANRAYYGGSSNNTLAVNNSGYVYDDNGNSLSAVYADYASAGVNSINVVAVNNSGYVYDDNGTALNAVNADYATNAYYGVSSGNTLAVNNGSGYVYDDNGNSLNAVYADEANYLYNSSNGINTANNDGSIQGWNGGTNNWSIDQYGSFSGIAYYASYGATSGYTLAVNNGTGYIYDDNGNALYADRANYGAVSGGTLAVNNGSNYVTDDNGNYLSAEYADYADYASTNFNTFFHTSGFTTNINLNEDGSADFTGNVGIGTTTPAYKLDVVGATKISSTGDALNIQNESGSNGVNILMTDNTWGGRITNNAGVFSIAPGYSTSMTLLTNGNVGIGTTTPSEVLTVIGNGRFTAVASGAYATDLNLTSDGTLTTSASDQRLKENIITLDSATTLEKILQLNPTSFDWKSNGSHDLGLIAQEVEVIFPELVFTNKADGFKGINYSRIPALLIAAVQELASQIASFKERFQTKELCLEDVCITKTELQELLDQNNMQSSSSPSNQNTDTPTPTDTATTTEPTPTDPTPEPIVEEIIPIEPVVEEPTPAPEPVVEPTPEPTPTPTE